MAAFALRASGAFSVTLASEAFDAYLVLVAPDGTEHVNDDAEAGTTDARVVIAGADVQEGTWTVLATTYSGGEVGGFRLRASPLAVAPGETQAGSAALPVVVDTLRATAPPPPPPSPEPFDVERFNEAPFPGGLEADDEPLALYPAMERPDRVTAGERFSVLVSLTEARTEATAAVDQGVTTDGGALTLGGAGTYEVVLHAPGFEIASNTQRLVVFETGDSTPARFVLTPAPGTEGPRALHATLWQADGAFVARFSREVCVGVCTEPPALGAVASGDDTVGGSSADTASGGGGAPPAGAPPTGAASGDEGADTAGAGTAGGGARGLGRPSGAVTGRYVAPDLTIEMIYGLDPRRPRRAQVTVRAGALPLRTVSWDEPEGAEVWVRSQLSRLAALSARGPDVAVDSSRSLATADGIGEALWARYAPPVVQDAFWAMTEAAEGGAVPFETIQVVSNDAMLPWELMRPTRGRDARGFLGAEFDLGRWHVDTAAPRLALRPPQAIPIEGLTLLAPSYSGADALPAQEAERRALLARTGAAEARATFGGLSALFADPPPHIVHFAGHGQVRREGAASGGGAGSYGQVVLLEDGPIDLLQWRGLLGRAREAPPFVFFNACEVGQTDAAAGFVMGWATTLLDAGTAGYVGALWPVGDAAAAGFAEAFYRHLYARGPARGRVAAALRRARAERYAATADPTHLAYAYYGDPLQRLDLPE